MSAVQQVLDTSIIILNSTSNIVTNTSNDSVISANISNNLVITPSTANTITAGIIGPKGDPGIAEEDVLYSKRIDFISESELYKGEATVGSSESSAVWRIRKITIGVDGDVTEIWASGNTNFDKQWTQRLVLSYS